MNIRRFENNDAKELAEVIAYTFRTTNIKDYSSEFIENSIKNDLYAEKLIERFTHEYMHFISRSEVDNLRSKVHKVIPDETKMLKNAPSKNSLISKNEFVADSMAMVEFGNKEKYSESKWNSWEKIYHYFFK